MANDFTVTEFLAWCRTKPADEAYDFTEATQCAVARFGQETGRDELVGLLSTELEHLNEPLFWAVIGSGRHEDWTFGALVKRLEAIVQETPVEQSPWTNPQTYLDADVGEHVL